jgi:hypothetical protein
MQRDGKSELTGWRYNAVQVAVAGLSVFALITIIISLPMGLLGSPEMHVAGNGSQAWSLQWFSDRSISITPAASVISVPIWIYKILILMWALWLSFALIRWLPWVWKQFVADVLWKPRNSLVAPQGNSV